MKVKCPTCQTQVEWNNEHPFKPFCSERCKLIDLGEWAEEKKRIAGEQVSINDIPPSDEHVTH